MTKRSAPEEAALKTARERALQRNAPLPSARQPEPGPIRPINRVRDVIKVGKRRAVITSLARTRATGATGANGYTGWEFNALFILGRSPVAGRLSTPTYTTSRTPLPITGVWQGSLHEGSIGAIVPSDGPGRNLATYTNTGSEGSQKESTMAKTVNIKRGGGTAAKKGATATKPKAATAAKPAARKPNASTAKIKAEVQQIAKRLKGGGKMKAEKERYGISADTAIIHALYHAGFDSKGNPLPAERQEPIKATGAALGKRLVKERQAGVPLYELAARTGKSEAELKKLIADAGGPTKRVYRKEAAATGGR